MVLIEFLIGFKHEKYDMNKIFHTCLLREVLANDYLYMRVSLNVKYFHLSKIWMILNTISKHNRSALWTIFSYFFRKLLRKYSMLCFSIKYFRLASVFFHLNLKNLRTVAIYSLRLISCFRFLRIANFFMVKNSLFVTWKFLVILLNYSYLIFNSILSASFF